MSPLGIVLVVVIVLLLFGGLGTHFGGWGGPAYRPYGYGGFGIGGILLIILLLLLLSGRL
jgi:hypothetical protein